MAVALFSKDVEVHGSAVMVVLDTYPRMIIEIISNQWPPKQVFKLTQNEKDQSFMRKITPLQRQMISKLDTSGYINLDVSCIYKLIRHFNLLPVPKQGWGNKPSIHDTQKVDDVERMKIYRNDILHRPRGGLSEQEGKRFFQESYEMAKRLDISIGSPMNGFESKIKAIQCFSVDRQKYVEALEKCAEYQAQLQETRDTSSVDLYYGNDIMMKLGSSDNQNTSGDSQCSIYIRDQSLDVNAVIQKIDYIKKTLEEGPYNVIKLDGAESGSLILHISIPNSCFISQKTLHDSLQSFLRQFFLIAEIRYKTGLIIVLAESDRYTTDDDEQDLEFLLEKPLPILKLNVNVLNSAFQNENILYKEVNRFVTGMYDAMDNNGVPVNGSQREVMMLTGPEKDLKGHLKEPYMDALQDNIIDVNTDYHWRRFIMELCYGQIVKNVIPSGLLPNLGVIFSTDEKRYIRSLERMESSQRAMVRLLEILDHYDNKGKWQIFKEALIENDYQWLVDFIEGDCVNYEDTHTWELLINVFQKTLSANIKPNEILPYLKEKSVISDKDLAEVEQMCKLYGENVAVFQLLTYLPKCKHNAWYPEFINILYENGYSYVVKEIDRENYENLQVLGPALFDSIDVVKTSQRNEQYQINMEYDTKENSMSEIQKTYGHNPSDVRLKTSISECTVAESKGTESNANESDVKQNYVSVSENYRKSTNNLSCPKEKHEGSMDELQDSIMSSLMSFDENNLRSRDETSEKNVFSTESAKPHVVDKDMSLSSDLGEREPNSILFEQINRDLAIAVSETPEEIQHNILQMPYDEVESDSDSDDETIPKKVLNLREYQKELAEPAKDGKNCLIVAPTGCGKTHVIMDIIQDHNSKMSRKGLIVKVAVLVEQQALAEQQAERCKEYLQPLRVKLITGEIHREEKLPKPLSSWLKRRDILVITSALLDNSLKSGDIKIEDFTLLVFDECHHAKDKHSYARVMHYYMDRKFDHNFQRERLPKVIGLTASVGVGKSNKIPGAKNHIKATMSNLDAVELVTVKKNRLELSEHVVVPDKGIIVAPARQKDHFGKTLVKLMESTEKHIFTTPHAKMFDGKDSILKAPTEKGSDAYTQWISRLRRETAQIKEEARRYITTWRSYLNVYNQALIIYEDARVKDATNYLEDKMDYLNEGIIKNEIDDTMKRLYDITKPMFVACIDDKSYENPKLKELKTVIFKMLREKRDSRIIVFIKTRDLADAMVNWMRETDGLDRLKPHKFVGAQAAGAKGGMTKKDQTEILKLFKDGNRQIVCATSVAEEGLDIPTCNLVIRYDHVTNETAMIQSRGRGRAEGCQFIIIASEKRKTAEKEEINEIREEIMKEAIEEIQSDIKDNKEEFVEELEEIQRLAKKKRDKDALSEKGSSDNKELELRCEKCNHYICMSTDIKKIQDAHHAVVNDEIRKNVTVKKCYSKRIDHQISVNAGKVKCINCGSGLGQIIKFSEAQFPVLKIEHFYVTDTTGKNSYYKKWKDVPFKPTALSDDDLESRLQGPLYVDI